MQISRAANTSCNAIQNIKEVDMRQICDWVINTFDVTVVEVAAIFLTVWITVSLLRSFIKFARRKNSDD